MINEERDLLEEIESRAWEYVLEYPGRTPTHVVISSDMFVFLCNQVVEATRYHPVFHKNLDGQPLRAFKLQTSSGPLETVESDKFGDSFLFVGKITDIFPGENELDLSERIILNADSKLKFYL